MAELGKPTGIGEGSDLTTRRTATRTPSAGVTCAASGWRWLSAADRPGPTAGPR